MPTGTRSSISANRLTKPIRATASLLMPIYSAVLILAIVHLIRMENQPPGPDRDQQHRRDVADPRHQKERPDRHLQIHGHDVLGARAHHLVEQRVGLHRHHEQQHQGREHVDPALVFRRRIGPDQIDGDVGAAIAGGGDAPEDQDAQHELAEIVVVGDRTAKNFRMTTAVKGVERDDADKERRDPFDGIDEAVHDVLARRPGRAGDDAFSSHFGIGGHGRVT